MTSDADTYFKGESGDHWCDIRHRGHYDPCRCACQPCTDAHNAYRRERNTERSRP